MNPSLRALLLALPALLATLADAQAQTPAWPAKAVTIVVPWSAGNSTDIVTRRLGALLSQKLGQPVVVDNRPGASGFLGTTHVAKAQPDGYTLLMASSGTHGAAPSLYRKLDFDPVKDFQPICRVVSFSNVMMVSNNHPAKTVQEFIAQAKAKPNTMSYASTGTGTSVHLAGELFKARSGVDLLEVPYKLTSTAVLDVSTGRVDTMFANVQVVQPQVEGGKVRALAVTGAQRISILPEVKTLQELGLPDYNISSWMGLVGPANMPPDVVRRLSKECGEILADSKFIDSNLKEGSTTFQPEPPEHFGAFIQSEIGRWRDIIKTAGVKPE